MSTLLSESGLDRTNGATYFTHVTPIYALSFSGQCVLSYRKVFKQARGNSLATIVSESATPICDLEINRHISNKRRKICFETDVNCAALQLNFMESQHLVNTDIDIIEGNSSSRISNAIEKDEEEQFMHCASPRQDIIHIFGQQYLDWIQSNNT